MDTKIFQNSYVIFAISFITLYIVFYLGGIGYTTETVNNRPVNTNTWRYPLGLSLIIWVFWHYYMYPVGDDPNIPFMDGGSARSDHKISPNQFDHMNRRVFHQKINMNNWN